MTTSKQTDRPVRRSTNLLIRGIEDFLSAHPVLPGISSVDQNCDKASEVRQASNGPTSRDKLPKRYTIYEPMLLLPNSFSTHNTEWQQLLESLSPAQSQDLYTRLIATFRVASQNITHIAVNAPIKTSAITADLGDEENLKRSPTDLQPLFGDFGPDKLLMNCSQPTMKDFDQAFWVETTQVGDFQQIWAPRWTMFSRGNIREKARILEIAQHNDAPFLGLTQDELGQPLSEVDVVDMYVGIGYFAIPYLKRGVRRVFGWDLNGWSIEGLRRGCEQNGFACEVVDLEEHSDLAAPAVAEIIADLLRTKPSVRCVAFLGDNVTAAPILRALSRLLKQATLAPNIRHCNLGLLPTSVDSWEGAVGCLDDVRGGWLHVHENVDVNEVVAKVLQVEEEFSSIATQSKDTAWKAQVGYTEMVKTYAPGIGHFVFDVNLWPAK